MNYEKIYPTIDLHGEYAINAKILTEEFLNDNIKLNYKKLCIIHGLGKGILEKTVHNVLRHDKRVLNYEVDILNPGCTLVTIKENL